MAIRPPARFGAHPAPPIAVLSIVVVLLLLGGAVGPAAAQQSSPLLRAPVDAPVVDPFRAPTRPWSSGNRGLEYATEPGTVVRAAADGEVVFAGAVAGDRFITVAHPFGLRSTVGVLDDMAVVVGQQVRGGDPLGWSGASLHFSVRAGDDYLDPAPLLAGARPAARLVIHDLFAGDGVAAQRAEQAMVAELQRLYGSPGPLEILRKLLPPTEALEAMADALNPIVHAERFLTSMWAWHQAQQHCTPGDVVAERPEGRRIAVTVAGYLSTSGPAGIDDLDVEGLGYAAEDVLRMSYDGGRIPGEVAADLLGVPTSTYEATATQNDLRGAGRELVRLLRAVSAAAPGVPIDVYAHSQGGIITRLALEDLALPEAVDLVVTIATPHQGADMATGLQVLRDSPGGDTLLTGVGTPFGVDPFAESPAALAEGSELLESLKPPPSSVRFLAIGARGDPVVPARHSTVPGHPRVVVPTTGIHAHEQVVAAPETTREAALALAGLPPGCESFADAAADAIVADAVMSTEDIIVGGVASYLAEFPALVVADGMAAEIRDRQ